MTHPLSALIAGVPRFDGYAEVPEGDMVRLSDVLAALEAAPVPDLADPVTVHANMLRGTIAKPTVAQIIHLYGREAFQPMIDAAVAKALDDACLAVSEHADWPEDEHGRTEQVGLFARVINAIRAIAPAQVNETPKSEHDSADVLTAAPVPDLVEEAGKVEANLRNEATIATRTEAADTIRALIALATAQAAQIKGLEKDLYAGAANYCALMERHDELHNALAALRAEVERLRGALQIARSIFDTPIAWRRLGLDPNADERLIAVRAELAKPEGKANE